MLHGAVYSVVCCQDLTRSHWQLRCTLFVELFALRASSRCKLDIGALFLLNEEILEKAPTPSLAECPIHGRSFARLW